MTVVLRIVHCILVLVCAPLLLGVVNRTKAFFAGRRGQPLLQPYYDILRLLRKGAIFSETATWIFRAGPVVGFVSILIALLLVPYGGARALVSFNGDVIMFIYILGIMRFFTVLAALDTGSSFEGMGASREVQFGALAEPALFLGLATLARETGSISLSQIYSVFSPDKWSTMGPVVILVGVSFFIVFLTENARVPVDDPNTHLELTMIHEVMILDHSGPDLGLILYTSAVKFFVLGAVLIGIIVPVHSKSILLDESFFWAGMFAVSLLVGMIESAMARLRFLSVPKLLLGALVLSILALIFQMR